MSKPWNTLKKTRPWHVGVLGGGLAILAAGIYAAFIHGAATPSSVGDRGDAVPAAGAAVDDQLADREVLVSSRLAFPQRRDLTFGTGGEVGEVLVREGDRVEEGQVLARLNPLTMTALEHALAQAELDLDGARKALEQARRADFVGAPLQRAEYEREVATGEKFLDDAERRLRDFERHYQQDLAAAIRARADAEAGLDDAITALGYFERDQSQDVANARKRLADAETALDHAVRDLANFDEDYQASLAAARVRRTSALETLRLAEDTLTAFYVSLGLTIRFSGFDDDVPHRSLEEMTRLQAAATAARASLERARRDLDHLEGNRPLMFQETQSAVEAARASLQAARDKVADLEAGIRPSLDYQQRRAAVDLARARLAQAESDLERELTGSDQEELAVREKELALARERLDDLLNPDLFDVALQSARVAQAQAGVDDARKNLEGGILRAPFDGVISLVNVKVEDIVNDKSRVMEIIAPEFVTVDGLIDASDLPYVREGALARVTISSVPDRELEGTVTWVGREPRTERGVVSYPLRIQVDLPDGVEVPVRLSSVTSVVLYQGRRGF